MYALRAVVPDAEVPRSEIIATRLARKIAPLFGVVWEQNPFARTWVCDYGALTLAEIARGAPYPSREEQARLDAAAEPGTEWRHCGRAIWTPRRAPTPAALSNASINRYGPDTKAAAVLTGVNVLLRDSANAIAAVCRYMSSAGVGAGIRLAVWAGLTLEVYRAHPALVTAGIQARGVQRSLMFPWSGRVDDHAVRDAARCEINFRPGHGRTDQPHRLDFLDTTLPLLGLPVTPGVRDAATSSADVLDAVADRWCQRILEVGRPGRGIVWLTEDPPGHREVQAYLRVGSVVAPFVAELMNGGAGEEPGPLYRPPADLADASPAVRRAHLIAVHVAVNYLRFRDDLLHDVPNLRRDTRETVLAADEACRALLDAGDPVRITLGAYARYLTLTDVNRTSPFDRAAVESAVDGVLEHQNVVTDAWRKKNLDAGSTAYLLEIMNVELGRAGGLLGRPERIQAALSEHWRDHFRARGIDIDDDLDTLTDAHRYHLHNYAGYLCTLGEVPQLRRAFRLQQMVVDIREKVTRSEPASYVAKYTSSRTAHEVAAGIAVALIEALGPDRSSDVLGRGLAHAAAVLANPTTDRLLLQPEPDTAVVWTALSVLPLVAIAVEAGHPGLTDALLSRSRELLRTALSFTGINPWERRHLAGLAKRLEPVHPG